MIIVLAKKSKIDLDDELEILSKIKMTLKNEPIVIDILRDYGKDKKFLEGLPIDFSDEIDVSAKTINSRILINRNLLKENFEIIMRYVVHELVHSLQHIEVEEQGDQYKNYEYLDRPDELEAFQYQIEFDKEHRGEEKAVEYVENLLDYHNIPDNEKVEKKEELLKNI